MWLGAVISGRPTPADVCLVRLCPPIPSEDVKSQARKWAHVEAHKETLLAFVRAYKPKIIVSFGELATRVLAGRAIAITKSRGTLMQVEGLPPILPMLSPGFVVRIPEHAPTFSADIRTLANLRAVGYDQSLIRKTEVDYQWRYDIGEFLGANKPKVIGLDTETTGLRSYLPGVRPITVQFSWADGKSALVPVHEAYWEKVFPGLPHSAFLEARAQIKRLVQDPVIRKIGSNIKFDHLQLARDGMEPKGWLHDTQLLAFQCDENMMDKGLDQAVRTWVPEMAGYADAFNKSVDKSKMLDVAPDVMLPYAGGDPDASMRLARVLLNILKKDPKQANCYRRIQMPAILMFAQVTEQYGVDIDKEALRVLRSELEAFTAQEYSHLIRMVPAAVRREHMDPKKGLKFSRSEFVIDTLFSEKGFGLTPMVFTEGTRELKDESKRIPSTSGKEHFPYFVTHKNPKIADFVSRLIEYQKTRHMSSTYVGEENALDEKGRPIGPTGFWQYLDADRHTIYTSFKLHGTNTGRTSSSEPNGQNFPKRGRWAKSFLSVFLSKPGFKLGACDLSQVELRLVAWMAKEPTMLAVYARGGDIHETTAAIAMGIPEETMASWKDDERYLIDCANEIPGSGAYLQSFGSNERNTKKVSDYYDVLRYRAKADEGRRGYLERHVVITQLWHQRNVVPPPCIPLAHLYLSIA